MDDQNCNVQQQPHMLKASSPKNVSQNTVENEVANGVQNQKDSKTTSETRNADEIIQFKEKCALLESKLELVLIFRTINEVDFLNFK